MKENNNRAILVNTAVLYLRMAVVTVCSLFITRFALKALGVDDFGLFSVVGSVISFVGVINTIMVSTSNRYIAVAIGNGDKVEVNRVFNVCVVIHILIAIATAIVALPVGDWYIHRYVNYNGPIENALMVYNISIVSSIIAFITVPFNGLLMAKEKFIVFCSIDMLSQIFKLTVALSLLYFFEQKLLVYAGTQAFLTAIPTLIYWLYCQRHYPEIANWKFVRERKLYVEMLKFSGWVGFGAVATVGKAQGAQLLINSFFNTVMNASLGVANTVNHFVTMFSQNVTQPIAPQITKSYAAGDYNRCNQLLIKSTKFAFLTMLLVSSPFFSDMDWILMLWLGEVPEYASMFGKLLVLDALIGSFNSGIANVIFANGKIAFYQLSVNTLRLLSVIIAYFVLKSGAPAFSLFYVYILITFVTNIFIQISIYRVRGFSFRSLAKGSYIPSLLVCILYVPMLFIPININPLFHMAMIFAYLCVVVLFVGFRKNERQYFLNIIKSAYRKYFLKRI